MVIYFTVDTFAIEHIILYNKNTCSHKKFNIK